ncbi:MAG: hypothetical protein ACI3ZG_06130 [Candidatus Coprenecus sp.]
MKYLKKIKFSFGIRSRVMAASAILVLVLLFSGIVAFFEFGRMSKDISFVLSNNITSVNEGRILLELCDKYQSGYFRRMNGDVLSPSEAVEMEDFSKSIGRLLSTVTTDNENIMVDSVRYALSAYLQMSLKGKALMDSSLAAKNAWFFEDLQPVFNKLRDYVVVLTNNSQKALSDNYSAMNDSYYRSIMPSVVAMGAGIILIILFNYFLNIYLLRPVIKIYNGIRDYREHNKSYNVTFDYNGDQIQNMNTLVKEIIDENKRLKAR